MSAITRPIYFLTLSMCDSLSMSKEGVSKLVLRVIALFIYSESFHTLCDFVSACLKHDHLSSLLYSNATVLLLFMMGDG